jgi:hypothetical protein
MINLIPKNEKRVLLRSFYYRLLVSFFMLLGFSGIIALAAIIPSYYSAVSRERDVNVELQIQQDEPVPAPEQETLLAIKELNKKLSLIGDVTDNKFVITERVIDNIYAQKPIDIKITGISYTYDMVSRRIEIKGDAPSRETLLEFRQSLEDGVDFIEVDLPISNFVPGSDIEFSLSLMPST